MPELQMQHKYIQAVQNGAHETQDTSSMQAVHQVEVLRLQLLPS